MPVSLPICFGVSVAPARERGLKYYPEDFVLVEICRSREGAWIEIEIESKKAVNAASLPRGSVD